MSVSKLLILSSRAAWFCLENAGISLNLTIPHKGEWSESYQLSDGTHNSILPTLAADGENVYVAWADKKGEDSQVKLRSATLLGN